MYWLPRLDFLGNCPVWSEYINRAALLSRSITLKHMSLCFVVGRGVVSLLLMANALSSSSRDAVLVDPKPLGVFCPCPFCNLFELGLWQLTGLVVSPGHDANCLFLMAFSHVGLVGNLAEAW